MLLNREGKVFIARRIDTPGEAWQMPQGGIDAGENSRQAVLRELAEEIGTAKAEIVAESDDWLTYDLPRKLADRKWGGRYRGQRQRWFVLRFTGADNDIALDAGGEAEFCDWRWVDIERLPTLIVGFKRRLYEDLVARFGHLARPTDEVRMRP